MILPVGTTRIWYDGKWYEDVTLISFTWMFPAPDPSFMTDTIWFEVVS